MATLGDLIVKIGADIGNFNEVMSGVAETVSGVAERISQLTEMKGFEALHEKLSELGDKLKEFGMEALTTFGNVEKVSISMRALTGDAEETARTIEHLKEVSISNALSFPSLIEAQQRMTAFGFEAEKIPRFLQAAANAAAATNKDFGEVADKMDRLVLAGNASGKALSGLGLSVEQLAVTMGVTADEVKGVFKNLDEGMRMQVLTESLEKFKGVAEEVAQGIAGQFKNVKTQIEFLFEDIGTALAPVAQQLLQIVNTEIIPFLKDLVKDFNNLPTPVKDTAVALGVMLAALIPLAASLSGFGFAITGLIAVMPAVTGLLTMFGVQLTAVGIALAALSAVSIVGLVASVALLAKGIYEYEGAVKNLRSSNDELEKTIGKLETRIKEQGGDFDKLKFQLSDGYITQLQYIGGLRDMAAALGGQKPLIDGATASHEKSSAELIKEKSALDAAAAATEAYAAKVYAAYAQLGVKNFSSLTHGSESAFSDLQAFDQLKATLGDPRLLQAADTLEAKLQEAFHAGAISAEEFDTAVQHIEDSVAAAAKRLDDLKKEFKFPVNSIGPEDSQAVMLAKQSLDELYDSEQLVKAGAGDMWDKFDLADRKLKNTADEMKLFFANAAQDAATFQQSIAASMQDAMQKSMTAPLKGWGKFLENTSLTSALGDETARLGAIYDKLGLSVSGADGEIKKTIADFDFFAKSGVTSLSDVEAMWQQISGAIGHLAKSDLPAAVQQYQILLDAMTKRGASEGALLAVQQQQLSLQIKAKELRGTDATAEIEHLTQLQYQTKALVEASTRLGDVYVSVRKTFDDAFNAMEKGLVDAIVSGKNLGDVFINLGKQVLTSILDTIIKAGLQPLQAELNKTGGIADTVAKSIAGVFKGSVGSAASTAASAGSGEVLKESSGLAKLGTSQAGDVGSGEVSGAASSSSSTASSTGGAAGAAGSLTSVVNLVSGAVTAISSVISNFQFSHMNKLLGEIEVTTRGMLNVLGVNGDESIFGYTKASWMDLQQMLGQLSDLHNDNVAILGKLDEVIASTLVGGGGGGTGGGGGAEAMGALFDTITNLRQDMSTFQNSLIYGSGGGAAGKTSIDTVVQSMAYSLPAAINTTTQAFTTIASQISQVAQSLSQMPPALTSVQQVAKQITSSYAGGVPVQGPGGANTYAEILRLTGGTGNVGQTLFEAQSNLAVDLTSPRTDANAVGEENRLRQLILDLSKYSSTKGSWGGQMPGASIDPNAYQMPLYQPPPVPQGNAWANPWGAGGPANKTGPGIQITVNALDPSARGIGSGIIQVLRENGVRI